MNELKLIWISFIATIIFISVWFTAFILMLSFCGATVIAVNTQSIAAGTIALILSITVTNSYLNSSVDRIIAEALAHYMNEDNE